MRVPNGSKLPERFWSKVAPDENGCWIWTGRVDKDGYGRFDGSNGMVLAHRIAAADAKGPIPTKAHALHHCDNPPCVNHEHLYFGTHQDNMNDKTRRVMACEHPWWKVHHQYPEPVEATCESCNKNVPNNLGLECSTCGRFQCDACFGKDD